MDAVLQVCGLAKYYGDFRLKDVSFDLAPGSIMGFIGENGAGKSTTIKAILNIIRRDGGSVEIFGLDSLSHDKQIKEQIGVVFEESCFHDGLNAIDISKIMANIYRNWDNNLFTKYCHDFKLPVNKKVKEYSRGMKMKLSIAAALSHKPRLLILDEATSGLDPVVRDEILDIFADFVEDNQHAILLSSHITSDLDKVSDSITFIHDGEIIFSESHKDLLNQLHTLHCGEDEFNTLKQQFGRNILRYRKNMQGYDLLIDNFKLIINHRPELTANAVNLEDIMLFYARGKKLKGE